MKIAFISLNREMMPDPVVPLGILSVMAHTPGHHQSKLWDFCFEENPLETLPEKINDFKPDLFALSLRNLHDATYSDSTSRLDYCAEVIENIRKHSDAPVLIGGAGFSVLPEKAMKICGADFGIAGEGEVAFPRFLQYLEEDRLDQLQDIPRLYQKVPRFSSGQSSPKIEFLDIGTLNPPLRELADQPYLEFTGTGNVQTKRGCGMHCTYCTYPTIEGNKIRTSTVIEAADDMERAAARPGTEHLFVVDSVFNFPRAGCEEFCRELIRRNFKTPWTCYLNPLGFRQETAELMKKAGCQGYEIGSDSGCDEVLKSLKKGFKTKDIRHVSEISKKVGLKDCHTFILGTTGETLDDVRRSLDFIVNLNPYAAIAMAWVDDDTVDQPGRGKDFNSEVIEIMRQAIGRFPRWVMPQLKFNFETDRFAMLRNLGMKGPLWYQLNLAIPFKNQKG